MQHVLEIPNEFQIHSTAISSPIYNCHFSSNVVMLSGILSAFWMYARAERKANQAHGMQRVSVRFANVLEHVVPIRQRRLRRRRTRERHM